MSRKGQVLIFKRAKKIEFVPISRNSWMFLCSRFIAMSQINNKTTNNLALDISNNILWKEQFISLKVGWTVFHILSFLPIYLNTKERWVSLHIIQQCTITPVHGNKEKNLSKFLLIVRPIFECWSMRKVRTPTHMKTFALQRHFNNGSLDTYTANSSIRAHTIESGVERGRQRGRNNKSY